MKNLNVNFSENCGKIKPMHAVNNGPVYKFAETQRVTNMDAWKEAGIPYSRTHDSAFYNAYGGCHTVDVNLIFRDFDADPYLPESYDFACTDEYLKVIIFSGTKVFYRLGASIEHYIKKYYTLPPKDFKKWAIICEHIIKHYTLGWANGFNYDIQYWEIWNEPDEPDDWPNKCTWGGVKTQFFDFYEVAAKHLKTCFPNLKIGGPALSCNYEWARDFLFEMKKRNVPMDFFSWHKYTYDPSLIFEDAYMVRKMLDDAGYTEAESINDEWNYVKGWTGDDWIYSLRTEKKLKGASFILSTICACQYAPLDILMYYDARPSAMNGMFSTDLVCDTLKGYYPFKMFNELYKLENCVKVNGEKNIFACAAENGKKAAVTFSCFDDNESVKEETLKINFSGFCGKNGVKATYFLLDADNNLEPVREEVFCGNDYSAIIKAKLFDSYLIILEKM